MLAVELGGEIEKRPVAAEMGHGGEQTPPTGDDLTSWKRMRISPHWRGGTRPMEERREPSRPKEE